MNKHTYKIMNLILFMHMHMHMYSYVNVYAYVTVAGGVSSWHGYDYIVASIVNELFTTSPSTIKAQ